MPTNYFNAVRSTVANQTPGYRHRGYIAPTSAFTTIAEPTPGVGAPGQTISTDHVFIALTAPEVAGFYELYFLPKTTEAPGESTGPAGAVTIAWKPKVFIPGDTAEVQALVNQLLNDDLILLLEDATCPDGGVRQYGCECTPVIVTKASFVSSTVGGTAAKGWELELEAECRFFYEGTVVKYTPS